MVLALDVFGQAPDVAVKLNLNLNYRTDQPGNTSLHSYDTLGHLSTVGLQLITEPGFRIYVSQKLGQVAHDGDPDFLDEFYIEDQDNWRVGKQYLLFGSGTILRESVVCVRSDTTVSVYDIPVVFQGCDGGSGRQRGLVIRAGGRLGFSLAAGNHFGINATALDLVRRPEDAPGIGRGYKTIVGTDYFRKDQLWTFRGEALSLTGGETSLDKPDAIFDFSIGYDPTPLRSYLLGFTQDNLQGASYIRFQAILRATKNINIEPLVRYRNGLFYDFSVALRIRL